MERRRRSQLQSVATLLGAAACVAGCTIFRPPAPRPEFKGEQLQPNEIYHAVKPCEEHILAPARVQFEVAVDEDGEPRDAVISSLGGTLRHAFASCARTQLLVQDYAPSGKKRTVGAIVDLRVGAYSSAGSATPIPPNY